MRAAIPFLVEFVVAVAAIAGAKFGTSAYRNARARVRRSRRKRELAQRVPEYVPLHRRRPVHRRVRRIRYKLRHPRRSLWRWLDRRALRRT